MANSNIAFSLFFAFFVGHGIVELQASHHVYSHLQTVKSSVSAKQPYRTGYHFQPPKNWINDPNGIMVYKGVYHLFYQYNPKGAVWGNIVWAHSTSKDLVNWTPHEAAIYPSQPSDINGCWSGSATILPGGKPAILYTGIDPLNRQVQNLAIPKNLSDPYLREWIKSAKNPLMQPTAQNHINASSFRDPTTAWLGPDKQWRVIVGSKVNRQGLAILFKSKDFVNWVQSKTPLDSAKNIGMWECPDFFPVLVKGRNGVDTSINGPYVKHVLKVSLDDTRHDIYTIGSYDNVKDVYTPDKGSIESYSSVRYDYGKYYASKTFFDNVKNRRILMGWINESSSVADDIKKGWSGVHAIPRKIWLDGSGKQLVQWPVPEIQKLRANHVSFANKTLRGGSVIEISNVNAAQADVDVSFEIADLEKAEVLKPSWTNAQLLCSRKGALVKGRLGPFGLLVLASDDLKENTAVFFRIFKRQNKHVVLICSDQSRSSLNQDNDKTPYGAFLDVDIQHQKLSLRSLIDHSIVESFCGGGKVCITSRVYPTLAINKAAHLYAFNNGTQAIKISKLNAWSMKTAKIN
ncbi:Beta-fructofuranosidase, insoluble isoenzyme CWINV3 [Hibiscus syriacus]|uniref:Beta-fructofuranosidase, insoluble isoenzyme CWINV3 n=1 Tax=Hibiscus syriacus TaxID=106335 RepID=A0A6A2YBR5_HIBSY|nr:beta-fructofuranosidase, insoluble isoenzyme CWINV1-like [Hibiscus syriacus]KAE8675336.1 Beta-fructofuranosidase, insoluble isoenzyme CWINV3 [Hibiscus syriacus]